MTLDEARDGIGRLVVYGGNGNTMREEGVITSVNNSYVFVRYTGDMGSKATAAEALQFSIEGEKR